MKGKSGVLAAFLAALFLVGSAVPVRAVDRDDHCERRVRQAEENLERAIRKHGEHSRQAEQRRRELHDVRERCHWDRDHDHH